MPTLIRIRRGWVGLVRHRLLAREAAAIFSQEPIGVRSRVARESRFRAKLLIADVRTIGLPSV